MPILRPHNPEVHERQEPERAGVGWWAKESVKLLALVAQHGEALNGSEAAAYIGVNRARLQALGSQGVFRRFPLGRHVFYLKKDLDQWKQLKAEGKIRPGRNGRTALVFT